MTHDWYRPRRYAYPICRICGVVKRADGKNKPCKGPTRLRPMEGETPAEARSHLAIEVLDKVADIVLAYRPTARSKPAVQRKRRKTILEKKRAAERK